MSYLEELIEKCANDFVEKTRENGEKFVLCNNNTLTQDEIREIHGTDFMPDNFRFATIAGLFQRMTEYDINNLDRLDDVRHEIVDNEVDIYTSNLLEWIGSNLNRTSYCDEAMTQGLCEGGNIISSMMCGQYMEIDELFGRIQSFLSSRMEMDEISEE